MGFSRKHTSQVQGVMWKPIVITNTTGYALKDRPGTWLLAECKTSESFKQDLQHITSVNEPGICRGKRNKQRTKPNRNLVSSLFRSHPAENCKSNTKAKKPKASRHTAEEWWPFWTQLHDVRLGWGNLKADGSKGVLDSSWPLFWQWKKSKFKFDGGEQKNKYHSTTVQHTFLGIYSIYVFVFFFKARCSDPRRGPEFRSLHQGHSPPAFARSRSESWGNSGGGSCKVIQRDLKKNGLFPH